MNKKKWDKLPDFAKKAIDQVANREFGLKAAGAFDKEDAENIAMAKAKGIQIHKLSDADKAKVRDKLKSIWDGWIKKKSKRIPAKKILDATLVAAKATQ
ncbi:MAG: hypothetical protein JRJ27_13755, partial [Deltaproteobacteria bacterium]|nr:hypothetical protein [Deltaproteobacteria bacterium]